MYLHIQHCQNFTGESGWQQIGKKWRCTHCMIWSRLCLTYDGTPTETRFRLSAKRASPFKSEGASVQSTNGSWGVRISGSNAGYTMFRGSVKGTGYPLHSPVSPSLPLPYFTVYLHISTGVYFPDRRRIVLFHTTKLWEMVQHKLEKMIKTVQILTYIYELFS